MASLVNSTYLGGLFEESVSGIVVDTAGNPYITGESWGGFPGENNALNDEDLPFAFVAQLDFGIAGFPQLVFSMYFGGSQEDRGQSIAGDRRGDLYVTGRTYSDDFDMVPFPNPIQPGGIGGSSDAFIVRITPDQPVPFPTVGEPAASDTTADTTEPPPPGSRMVLPVGIGITVLLVGTIVFFVVRRR